MTALRKATHAIIAAGYNPATAEEIARLALSASEPVAYLIAWRDERRGGVSRTPFIVCTRREAFEAEIRGYDVTPLGPVLEPRK